MDQLSEESSATSAGVPPDSFHQLCSVLSDLAPFIIGLAVQRGALIVSTYGAYNRTDANQYTDGATAIAIVFLFAVLLIITRHDDFIPKRIVNTMQRVIVAAQACVVTALGILSMLRTGDPITLMALSAACTIFGAFTMYYWARCARGSEAGVAAVFVFSGLALSIVEVYLCSLVPPELGMFLAAALSLLQYPCMRISRKRKKPYAIRTETWNKEYFAYAKNVLHHNRFLISTTLGIALLSLVIGFLRGYPEGQSIAFTSFTRFASSAIAFVVCLVVIYAASKGRIESLTYSLFAFMSIVACLALVLYTAFPNNLEYGAVATTVLNTTMVGLTWHITVAFMSNGWRDPYYYGSAGWIVFLGFRSLSRTALLLFAPSLPDNYALQSLLLCAFIICAIIIMYNRFNRIAIDEIKDLGAQLEQQKSASTTAGPSIEKPENPKNDSFVNRIMALADETSLAEMRQKSMKDAASAMGKQFMLTQREVEVLALYASGYTQQRVAEELFISQSTAHAHIKRIYSKTNLHSRQELIDYLQQYV